MRYRDGQCDAAAAFAGAASACGPDAYTPAVAELNTHWACVETAVVEAAAVAGKTHGGGGRRLLWENELFKRCSNACKPTIATVGARIKFSYDFPIPPGELIYYLHVSHEHKGRYIAFCVFQGAGTSVTELRSTPRLYQDLLFGLHVVL